MHQDGSHAVDRFGELSDDRMARVEGLSRRQSGERADDADAKAAGLNRSEMIERVSNLEALIRVERGIAVLKQKAPGCNAEG